MTKNPNGFGTISDGYRYYNINGKRISEQRLVMEQHIKRKLKLGEIVHHIDGNKLNNEINNLVITCRGKHTKLHYLNSPMKQKHWHEIVRPLGSKAHIKVQEPRPKPIKKGQKWNHHKNRKGFIVIECKICHNLFWQRSDYSQSKGFCRICSGRNANKIRWTTNH